MRLGCVSVLLMLLLRPAFLIADAATQPAVSSVQKAASDAAKADLERRIIHADIVRLWPGDPPATRPATPDAAGARQSNVKFAAQNLARFPGVMVFPATRAEGLVPAVIICPGGGYSGQATTKEGFEVARRFSEAGFAAFVLRYRLPDGRPPPEGKLPVPQQDALRAIQSVRARSADWRVDPDRIGIVGFSAGGHLAATAATMYDQAASIDIGDAIAKTAARPDFAILVYPVIRMDLPVTHPGSRAKLIGKEATPDLEARFDPSQHVTSDTPPLWVLQSVDDKVVPQANAMAMIAAAERAKIPHALLLISHGGHGFGLGNNPESSAWFGTCMGWLQGQNIVR